jgi:peptide-methionine (S)-S-oxide reductase
MNPLSRMLAVAAAIVLSATLPAQATDAPPPGYAVATFAGGCFWCMEPPYDKLDGVISTTSGFTDGHVENPSYRQVTAGGTGHTEAVQVVYDPQKVSFEKLVEVFWINIDPTDIEGQFCDRGAHYRPTLFYHDDEQRRIAEESKAELQRSMPFGDRINTPIVAASTFYRAEEYHQDYYQKNPLRYRYYRNACGRDHRLQELWGEAR